MADPLRRMWILDRTLRSIAIGYASGAYPVQMLVFVGSPWADSTAPLRAERGFVAWPPSGYTPAQALPDVWSFTATGADFASAFVTVTARGEQMPVTALTVHERGAAGGVSWRPPPHVTPPNTETVVCYEVTIDGVAVRGSGDTRYEYAVCVTHTT